MPNARQVSLFRNGRNQAVRIPVDMELPGDHAIIVQDGENLILKPVRKKDLIALLATLDDIEEEFPPFDEGLLPMRNIEL
jgi:antitoxin VapB